MKINKSRNCGLEFIPDSHYGLALYSCKEFNNKFSLLEDIHDHKFYIRIRDNNRWVYPAWEGSLNGFNSVDAAADWLNTHDWQNATVDSIKPLPSIVGMSLVSTTKRELILASINTRDITNNLVRVKSSNIWSYGVNIEDRKSGVGDVLVQFKSEDGGPNDIYIYYDVPITTYRRWHSAPSKGHFFWQYIRNDYKYGKLTGDKKTKLPNGVNYDAVERARELEERKIWRELEKEERENQRKRNNSNDEGD